MGSELPFMNFAVFRDRFDSPECNANFAFSSVMLLFLTYVLVSFTIVTMHYVTFFACMHPQLVQGAAAPKRVAEKQYTHIID